MYTHHGHQIKGTPVEGAAPVLIARCGGPSLCQKCFVEAQNGLFHNMTQEEIDTIFKDTPVLDDIAEEEIDDNRSLEHSEIENRYGYHKGTDITGPQHKMCRQKFMEMAEFLDALLPSGRAKALAMTELENAAMWGNKAIAEQAPLVTE